MSESTALVKVTDPFGKGADMVVEVEPLNPEYVKALEVVTLRQLLPDSRLADRSKGLKLIAGTWWSPVFCANCTKPYGWVPEENCLFAVWLCDDCADKWTPLTGTLAMPDEVFWARVVLEQIERYGHLLPEQELLRLRDEATTSLGKLLKAGV